MRNLWKLILVLSFSASLGGCGSDDSGLRCKSGDFYLDGQKFQSCDQCSSGDCGFEENATETCTYPNGVQECMIASGTVTAHCAGETATLVISNGVASCSGQ